MSEAKLTEEESQKQANIYALVSVVLNANGFDLEYCKTLSSALVNQASFQDATIVLNPSYPLKKNDLLRKQGQALKLLAQYVECLQEIDQLKLELGDEQHARDELARLFV